jgi:hypothetical protein
MKKAFVLFTIGTLLAAFAVSSTAAQGVSYTSGFQVQNLSTTDAASIVITYYPQGTGAPVSVTDSIPKSSSVTYVRIHTAAGDPFNGSVVISSDQPVAAIANTLGDFPQYGAVTGGFSEGSTSFSLPLIMCNNSGFDTWFNVQNAGSDTAHITINYKAGSHGADGSETASIEPGRAKTFDQSTGSTTKNCSTLQGSDGKFIGSATITSDEPVVATVMQLNTTNYRILMGYNGFTGGSPDIRAPLIMANNNGFYTGIQVQNVGTAATTVTIDYSNNTAGSKQLQNDVFNLAVGEAKTLIQSGSPPQNGSVNSFTDGLKYIGAATITSGNGQDLVAIVNQAFPGPGAGPFGTAYEAFSAGDATTSVSAPLVMSNNNTFYTGIQVQNVGSTATNVTIDYLNNTAGSYNPANETFSLQPGASWTVIQNGAPPNNGSTVNNWGTNKYIGAATITAGSNIVAIVNEFSAGYAGDQFYTYDAFNY